VNPPDRALAAGPGERAQHGEHRGHADAGAEQHDRPWCVDVEREVAPWGAGLEDVADGHSIVEEAAREPAGFTLDRDAICASVCGRSQRV